MPVPFDSFESFLNATFIAKVPAVGGGAFGAARLGNIVSDLQAANLVVHVGPGTLKKLQAAADRDKVSVTEFVSRFVRNAAASLV